MRRDRARRTSGLFLMLASLLVGVLAAPAFAAEGDLPEGLQEVKLERSGYWNGDNSEHADNAATSQFPPQAVCLVQPQACFFPEDDSPEGQLGAIGNQTTAQLSAQQQELLTAINEADTGLPPEDPQPPETLPVSVAFGLENYRSAIEIALPAVPDGHTVDSFVMVLQQGDPSYSNESPAFRQAVLAALTCASVTGESSPVPEEAPTDLQRCNEEEFGKIDPAQLSDMDTPLLIEACPIVGEWEADTSQDEETLPEVDCLYSGIGTPIEVENEIVWLFDMTFAAQAWADGTLEHKGILLRPGAAENFAYGDPETTYSKQVTFAQAPIRVAQTTSEPPPPPAPLDFPTSSFGSSDVFATPPTSGSSVSVPTTTSSTPTQPDVSQPTVEQPQSAGETTQTLAANAPLGTPENPWWLWLLVPVFLAGAWLLSRSFEEEAAVVADRNGAMSRLLERQQALRASDLVTG